MRIRDSEVCHSRLGVGGTLPSAVVARRTRGAARRRQTLRCPFSAPADGFPRLRGADSRMLDSIRHRLLFCMQLTLVVPGLLDFASAEPSRVDADGAALARLLPRNSPSEAEGGTVGLLCAMLGIARQRDWPVAPWLAAASGLDPGDSYWLLAEPVTLQVGQIDVQLVGVVDDLTDEESAALLRMLNAHF